MRRVRCVVRRALAAPFRPLLDLPLLRRVVFHARRMSDGVDALSARLRGGHNGTLLAVTRGGRTPATRCAQRAQWAQWAPSRRAARRASDRATVTTSWIGTDSRGACASRTSPGPYCSVGMPPGPA